MSASEEIQPSQCLHAQDHEEIYEEVVEEDVSTTTYPSFHLERPSPGRFGIRPKKNDDDDEDDDHHPRHDEDCARVLQPTPRRRPTPPSSLDVVAAASGSLCVKKQQPLRDPSASNLLKRRAKKQNLKMVGDHEYGADDTEILCESTPDVKRLVRQSGDKQRQIPSTPALQRKPMDLSRKNCVMPVDDYDEGDGHPPRPPPLKTSTPKKKPLLKRPPLKRQRPPPYVPDESEEAMDDDEDDDDGAMDQDGVLSTSCSIPSLANYALNAPIHTPQFLESGEIDRSCEANNIGVGYGEYFKSITAAHTLSHISVFTPHFYNVQ